MLKYSTYKMNAKTVPGVCQHTCIAYSESLESEASDQTRNMH